MTKGDELILSDNIPAWGKDDVTWSFSANLEVQKIFFECTKRVGKIKQFKLLLINSCAEIESSACEMNPNFLPIGPLLEINTPKSCSVSYNFHPEDASCLNWLDGKPHGSVIYVSFGSLAVFSQHQFDELALGLELSGRNFLWVVRLGLANGSQAVYPSGYLDRVRVVGKIVEWAPQEKVLSHPSVACFLSHCGWNSTLEGLSMGVRFLCWPSFADQFHNQNYICYKWETGLRIEPDEDGIRSRHEIKEKIDMVFSFDNLKANALKFKELCRKSLEEGGSSYNNFERFIDYLRK